MASTSDQAPESAAPPGQDNPKPRTRIRKGQACNNCRQLKIKCDGAKPQCGPCTRYKRQQPCHYADERANPRLLEDEIAALKEKIWSLEHDGSSQIGQHERGFLPEYYSQQPTQSNSQVHNRQPTHPSGLYSAPDFEQRDQYLRAFATAAPRIAFFLNSQRLFHRLSVRADRTDPLIPALLTSAQLFGLHLTPSKNPHHLLMEQMLLDEAVKLTATTCLVPPSVNGSVEPPVALVLDTIQAYVLLSSYLLRVSRFTMANVSVTSATSLVFFYKFHRRESNSDEQTELAFWQVYMLNKVVFLTVLSVTGVETLPRMLDDPTIKITIPWPGEQATSRQDTVDQFLGGVISNNLTTGSQYVKSIVLYDRAVHLERRWNASLHEQIIPSLKTIDAIADTLRSTIDPVTTDPVIVSLLHGVSIRAHRPFASGDEHSKYKCINSAVLLVELALQIYGGGKGGHDWCDILFGLLWIDATSIFVEHIEQIRQRRYGTEMHSGGETLEERRYRELSAHLLEVIDLFDAPPTITMILNQVRENCLRVMG